MSDRKRVVTGPDGYQRTSEHENRINVLCASVLGSAAGRELMDYIRSITTHRVAGPDISDAALRHLEGMRFLAAVLTQRIELGHKEKANVTQGTGKGNAAQ